ncbi:MAG: HAMP domain-containing histidine kinase [Elainella sp. C42_A2020_010]|nr:HAMP domain-containing histidine kinase [Elainella sp. C42_A2020_010]
MRIRHGISPSFKQIGLERTSLQLRLTVGITTIALLGIGSIGTWTAWQMRKMLVVDHKETMATVATHVSQRLAKTDPDAWQPVLDEWASPNLWLAAKRFEDGKVLARSGPLVDFAAKMPAIPWAQTSSKPTVQRIDGRQIVLCRKPVTRAGQLLGELYLARDVTHDYNVLSTLINTLLFATLLALAVIAGLIAMYIRRSLRPLRQMNQMASAQVGKPQPLSLPAQPVPVEVEGFVQAMSSLYNQLSETGERQRQFTNSLSHELRTSLSLIQGYVQSTLRRGDNLTPAQREALEIAASETHRMIHLLKDLLDLGRMNSGKLELCLKPISLNSVVESAIELVDPEQQRLIEVEAPAPVVAHADMAQISRVLMHLLKNAMQYSKPDQPIQLKLYQTSVWAVLQIRDYGCGIPASEHSSIFDPFYRVEASRCRSTGGIGLGLAIVKALVEGMAGKVGVESTPGDGSTFTVKLPLAPEVNQPKSGLQDRP